MICITILYTDTLLVVRLVRKRNNEDLEELPSPKRQKSSNSEGTCCYHSKEHDYDQFDFLI